MSIMIFRLVEKGMIILRFPWWVPTVERHLAVKFQSVGLTPEQERASIR